MARLRTEAITNHPKGERMTNSEDVPATVSQVARLGDTVAQLGDEIHELRKQLGQLQATLADEVRTNRLVVLGPDGSERITTMCNERATALTVQFDPPGAARWELYPKAELWATDGDHMTADGGEEIAKASLQLMTGDDSYNIIEQMAAESSSGRTLTERGSVRAYQQRTQRGLDDDKPITADLRIVTLDQRGVTETAVGDQVVGYSPLVRVPT